jgi:hypothetical protein
VGVKHSDCVLKVFLLRLGVGGGIKKFSAVKISVQGLGACGSGWDMFSGWDFLRLSILLFKAGRCVRGASVGIY